jgi:hypothetical protein
MDILVFEVKVIYINKSFFVTVFFAEFEENLNLARRLLTQVMDNRARGGPASSG